MTPDTSSWLTHNLQHDPKGVLHVLGDNFGAYMSVPVEASLGAVSTTPGDVSGRELLAVYEVSTTPGDVSGRELLAVYEAVSGAEHS